uniref:Uncharacterized protein n=1 Tax=Cannabis sativa TaxID=3483 RepID=A0A803PJU9_CANSA
MENQQRRGREGSRAVDDGGSIMERKRGEQSGRRWRINNGSKMANLQSFFVFETIEGKFLKAHEDFTRL